MNWFKYHVYFNSTRDFYKVHVIIGLYIYKYQDAVLLTSREMTHPVTVLDFELDVLSSEFMRNSCTADAQS